MPTTPVEPVYSVLPSGLGEVPLILLPFDEVPVPMAWLIPPPETRPLLHAALVDISEKAEAGPVVAPGVLTVTPTVFAYAVSGTARASSALMTSAFPAAPRRRSIFRIDMSFSEVDLGSKAAKAARPPAHPYAGLGTSVRPRGSSRRRTRSWNAVS